MEQEITQQQQESEMSNSIGKLAEALNKAQAEIEVAHRKSENPFFRSSYADLESVWNACRGALSKHGLAVVQTMAGNETAPAVITTLMHTSGEWIRGKLTLRPVKPDPQGVGSCITYARRYSLAAIAGVVPENEDDDGNAASGRSGGQTRQKPVKKTTPKKTKTWVQVADELKEALGKEEFDVIIGNAGFSTANEIEDKETQKAVYKECKEAITAKAKDIIQGE